jgi:hypothetical protein
MEVALDVINRHAAKVDGVKISLLDKDKEIVMRRRLAPGVRMYTGDDFNYAELIAGDDQGHSDALLGIFDAIAPAASAALAALAAGDRARFDAILAPTVPLSRHIFKAPTRFYKTGVVFMAYLNGLQDHFVMVGGQQSTRSLPHLAELFRLADRAGLLADPERAAARMKAVLAVHGVSLMRDFTAGPEWLSINTATVRKQWRLDRIIDECARRGIRAIAPWRDQVAAVGLAAVERQLRDTGVTLSGYCRGGFFPAADAAGLQAALDDNRRAVDEACTLRAPCLVLVVGSLPGALDGKPAHRDIGRARAEVRDGIAATLEYARSVGMPLAIEPLHPMQAAERACINTLEQALDLCDELDPAAAARWAWRWTCTTCGGTRSCASRSPAPAASACWPTTCATGSRPRATC